MLEYSLEKKSFFETYRHASMVWYKQKHVARIDGRPFDKPKPAKTWAESFSQTQNKFVSTMEFNYSRAKKIIEEKMHEE